MFLLLSWQLFALKCPHTVWCLSVAGCNLGSLTERCEQSECWAEAGSGLEEEREADTLHSHHLWPLTSIRWILAWIKHGCLWPLLTSFSFGLQSELHVALRQSVMFWCFLNYLWVTFFIHNCNIYSLYLSKPFKFESVSFFEAAQFWH